MVEMGKQTFSQNGEAAQCGPMEKKNKRKYDSTKRKKLNSFQL
jgi:hypothetical protein